MMENRARSEKCYRHSKTERQERAVEESKFVLHAALARRSSLSVRPSSEIFQGFNRCMLGELVLVFLEDRQSHN